MLRALVPALLLVLVAAGCGSAGGEGSSQPPPTDVRKAIAVSGSFAQKPTISVDGPLDLGDSASWTEVDGSGDRVTDNATVILQLTIADGRTGKTVLSTTDAGQRPVERQLGPQVFPSLVKALTGQEAGSRVVVVSTAEDAYGPQGAPQIGIKRGDPVVMVADILSTDPTSVLSGPSGSGIPAPATAPRLVERGGTPVSFDVSGLRKPRKLVVVPLRAGTGPVVEAPERVTVDYMGTVWGTPTPFDSSYGKEPASFSVGLGDVIPGWDKGLAGLKEGARVLLVCPPKEAYGADGRPPSIPAGATLVFVVDVLGVG